MTTNAEWMVNHHMSFSKLSCEILPLDGIAKIYYDDKLIDSLPVQYSPKVAGGSFTAQYWLDMERKKEILDKAEKNYLEKILIPLMRTGTTIKTIIKRSDCDWWEPISKRAESLVISYSPFNDSSTRRVLILPPFKAGTMYVGMKTDQAYTPQELGL